MSKRPNVVYSKRASMMQRAWLQKFYDQTGFDALYQDEYDRKLLSFQELVRKNCDWLESHNLEVLHNVEHYP